MFQDAKVYEEAYEQAVRKNEEAIASIEEFKKELVGVKQTLEENQKHLFQHIMAPLAGGKALIKAKLIHTNDVIVFLGDKWFVRTSAARAVDICNRKIARCNKNKAEIERQTERFSSNMEKAQEYELFSTEDLQDIVEPYDEEVEKLWKEKHKEKVREFKKQEAAERNKYRDEDLFKKLYEKGTEDDDFKSDGTDEETDSYSSDEDQSQANENEVTENTDATVHLSEFNRVLNSSSLPNKFQETRCSVDKEEETSNEIVKMTTQPLKSRRKTNSLDLCNKKHDVNSLKLHEALGSSNSVKENHLSSPTLEGADNSFENINATAELFHPDSLCLDENTTLKQSAPKKRVSFSTTDELKCYTHLESDEDTNIIRFKHSDVVPSPTLHENNRIESPSDIYRLIVQGFNLKSILKKRTHLFTEEISQPTEAEREWKTRCDNFYSCKEIVVGDISEKNPVEISKIDTSSRKPSKFRKARNKHNNQ